MTTPSALPDDQRAALAATSELAGWAAGIRWQDVPATVRDRLQLVLLDTLGITMVGARLPERAALLLAWAPAPGPCPLLGAGVNTTPETAAWLNATALVGLELDEGNKYAAGHPAAHGFPAVLALAAALDTDGPTTAAALLAAYEVAARFGRASRGRAGLHPHGNWGMTGAAAGCGRLLGLTDDQLAAAIDTAAGMPIAGPFAAALDGNPVRNEWMGASNLAGLTACRLAVAGIAHPTGIAARTLGDLLGTFDPGALTAQLGERWDVELGYFKRHASCAFTHPTADAAIALRAQLPAGGTDRIESVVVQTYSVAATLNRTGWANRLAAMFSIPYVAAAALRDGAIAPRGFADLTDPALGELARRVTVRGAEEFDRALPDARGARVVLTLTDGTVLEHTVHNPIGDADHQPLDHAATVQLIGGLLDDPAAVDRLERCAADLPASAGVRGLLQTLTPA
jgi:2-methylcitrate dehydratase PrpD